MTCGENELVGQTAEQSADHACRTGLNWGFGDSRMNKDLWYFHIYCPPVIFCAPGFYP